MSFDSFDSSERSDRNKNKKGDEKYDPVIIKTTTLKINIKTNGDLETKEYDLIPFHPNMADLRDLSNNNFVFFPSFVKITMKDLQRAGVGQDFPNVFMNLKKYIKLIKYVTSPEREEDNTLIIDKSQVKNYALSIGQNAMKDMMADFISDIITIKKDEPLTEEEIITNNIGLIKDLLFAAKSRFFILGNEYIIGESKYLPPYIPEGTNEVLSKNSAGVKIPMDYVITIQLQLLDAVNNPDAGDFSRMSCKAKKANIAKDSLDILGTNFGYIEIPRVSTPSILNTSEATKNRKFGKLQKEWESRNKYVKEPTTEQERIDMEKKWTPLQRKMAEFEKRKGDFSKIPPLWIKEREDLDKKYDTYAEEMIKLWNELNHIKENNKDDKDNKGKYPSFVVDLMDDVKQRMVSLTQTLDGVKQNDDYKEENINKIIKEASNVKKEEDMFDTSLIEAIDEFKDNKETYEKSTKNEAEKKKIVDISNKIIEKNKIYELIHNLSNSNEKDIKEKITDDNLIKKKKEEEKTQINDKYVKPLLETDELDKDIEDLKDKEADIKQKLLTLTSSGDPGDNYNAQSLKPELMKIQEALRKKMGDKEKKRGKPGDEKEKAIIKKWEDNLKEKDKFLKTIKGDKDKEDRKIKTETLNKELKTKFSEITKLKKEILKAKFFAGEDYDLSEKDKKNYEKKDRPLESLEDLIENLEELEKQYLDTAEKLNKFNMVQAHIKLLNEDLQRYKTYKDDIKQDIKKKEGEKKPKNDELQTNVRLLEKGGEDTETSSKIEKIKSEIKLIQDKIDKLTKKLDVSDTIIKDYNNYIKALKKIKESADDIKEKYDKARDTLGVQINTEEIKEKFNKIKGNDDGDDVEIDGGSALNGGKKGKKNPFVCKTLKYYIRAIRQRNRTKRRIKKYKKKMKKNTIKRRKKKGGKKKYTLHRRK